MLNLKNIKSIRLTCPKKGHSRYNPEDGGQNGIKSGCTICTDIYQVYSEYYALMRSVGSVSRSIDEEKSRRAL